jgi:hypothetical protein
MGFEINVALRLCLLEDEPLKMVVLAVFWYSDNNILNLENTISF